MGSLYAEHVLGINNPSVALLNIGEEETKGNEQVKETYQLLKNWSTINFAGNAEGRDIPRGKFDVVICDGFVGNVVLKTIESEARAIKLFLKRAFLCTFVRKIGALLLKEKNLKSKALDLGLLLLSMVFLYLGSR